MKRLGVQRWPQVLKLVSSLRLSAVQPDAIACDTAARLIGHWATALQLLHSFPTLSLLLDIFSYNAALMVQKRNWMQCLSVLHGMHQVGITPDLISYGAMSKPWCYCLHFFNELARVRLPPDIRSCTGCVSACAEGGWQLLLRSWHRLCWHHTPDLVSYNAAMALSPWQQALQFLEEMVDVLVTPDLRSYSAVISSVQRSSHWQLLFPLLREMLQASLVPDVVMVNSMIANCQELGAWPLALSLLRSTRADPMSYGAHLGVCAESSQWLLGLSLLEEMPVLKLRTSLVSCNALMTSCLRSAKWQWSSEFWQNLALQGFQGDLQGFTSTLHGATWAYGLQHLPELDLVAWNALLSCCPWSQALEVLGEMPKAQMEADVISFNSTLAACGREVFWEKALSLFQEMKSICLPDVLTFTSLMTCPWPCAILLLEEMLGLKVTPDQPAFQALISSCQTALAWSTAVSLLSVMRSFTVTPDPVSYNALMRGRL